MHCFSHWSFNTHDDSRLTKAAKRSRVWLLLQQLRVKITDVRKKISMYERILGLTSAAEAPNADGSVQVS